MNESVLHLLDRCWQRLLRHQIIALRCQRKHKVMGVSKCYMSTLPSQVERGPSTEGARPPINQVLKTELVLELGMSFQRRV